MNETNGLAAEDLPTPEQLVGRQLRLLRQGRNWSQLEVAEKMRAYGYQWSQATVTRLEGATRPIRLNELTDLAALYGVPITQLLESGAPDDLEALEREIEELKRLHAVLQSEMHAVEKVWAESAEMRASNAAKLARVEGRLAFLMRWHPRAREGGGRK